MKRITVFRLGLPLFLPVLAGLLPLTAARAQGGLQQLERIGLLDAAHTRNDGFQSSAVSEVNSSGVVLGLSLRYSGSQAFGDTPWVYQFGSGTRAIGLTGAEFTRNDGFQDNSAADLSESGWVQGSALRYLGNATSVGSAVWLANGVTATTTRIGLFDAEHTGGQYQFSEALFLTEAGTVGGVSNRYGASAAIGLGQSAWLAKPVAGVPTTARIGFYDGVFTSAAGEEFSAINRAVESGNVGGYSRRYAAGSGADLGQMAWVARWAASGNTTFTVGLYDAEHTDTDGYQFSRVQRMNEVGESAGYSERFAAGLANGRSAWLATPEGGQTLRVGFTDAAHTRAGDGYRYSDIVVFSETGVAGGISTIYATPVAGQSAWAASVSDGVTRRIGLVGGEHQSTSGVEFSSVAMVSDTGFLAGSSRRYDGESVNGQSAWVASVSGGNSTSHRVGLVDVEHTSSAGARTSEAEAINDAGRTTGFSYRYSGSSLAGQSAWTAGADGSTARVGLTGAEYTASSGYQYSSPEFLTVSGMVVGFSERYNGGSTSLGEAAWWATSAGVTQRIGLTDAMHTRADGFQLSLATNVSAGDLIAGFSQRYNGGPDSIGSTAWVYLPLLDQLDEIVLSVSPSGAAMSEIDFLLDSGLAAGSYSLYDGETNLGLRAFAWLPSVGAFDLGAYLGGSQFSNLMTISSADLASYLAGVGTPVSGTGDAAFAAIAVPEPSVGMLAFLGLVLIGLVRVAGKRSAGALLLAAFVGLLSVGQLSAASDPLDFDQWLSGKGVPGGFRAPTDDPDGDGFMNAVEFVLGTDPVIADAPGAVSPHLDTETDPEQPYFVYRQSHQSVGKAQVRVMRSQNLSGWEAAPGEPVELEQTSDYALLGHPVTTDANYFFVLEVRIPASVLSSSPNPVVPRDTGGLDLVIQIGGPVGTQWDGLPSLPNVSLRTEAAPVSSTDPTPNTSKYPSAAGANRGNFTPELIERYRQQGVRPPLRSWMGWFAWGDGTPPPGIKPGIHPPGQYGTYNGTTWDYFNYQWPKDDAAPDGGRSQGSWNPIRVDQQPLFLNPFIVNYNWAPGMFGYVSKPLKAFPTNTAYWQDKTIVRGVNFSSVNPFFYQYGDKLTASSVPTEWHQAWLYLAMRPLETTVIVPGNLKPTEVLQPGPWNQRPDTSHDPFPYPVWDKTVSAEQQTPFSIKIDRVGDFDADIIWEAANPQFADYYAAKRYQATPFSQSTGKGNYLKMTVGQGMPYAWCETNNSRYVTFYNLIRANTDGKINNNADTGAGVVEGGPWDVPGVTGVQFVLLYGNHVNPNQWYQEVPPWYFDVPTKQPGGFNPPPGSYQTKGNTTITTPGQSNHTYTAIFFKKDSVRPVTLGPDGSGAFNNGTDTQGNPFFYLEFLSQNKNWFVVANVPPMRYYDPAVTKDRRPVLDQAARDWASTLGQYAFNFPTATKVSYAVDNMSQTTSTFSTTLQNPFGLSGMTVSPDQTVLALPPHQYQPLTLGPDLSKTARPTVAWNPLRNYKRDFPVPASAPPNANRSDASTPSRWGYWGLRGNFKPIITGSYQVTYPFQNFLPVLPPPDYSRTVQQTGIPGVIVTNVGTGNKKIADAPNVTITDSSGKGSGATAKALVDAFRGEIQQIDIVSGGQGYPDGMPPATVQVTVDAPSSPNGRRATAYAQVGGGKVLAIFMLDKGAGYSSVISVTQQGSQIDPPIIVPNFDPVTGDLLPGLAQIIEEGAGFDFSRPITAADIQFFGTGTGAQFQIIKPGNLISVLPPLGGTGGQGRYLSFDGNPPAVTAVIPPPAAGAPAQTATVQMKKLENDYEPGIIKLGNYQDAATLTASFVDDSQPAKTVHLKVNLAGTQVASFGPLTPQDTTFTLNSPKSLTFSGGSPAPDGDAVARIYPPFTVDQVYISGNLVGGYTNETQVDFVSADQSDPAVPGVTAPQINVTIPAGGNVTAADLTITHAGSGLTGNIDYQLFGGQGFDAAFQPVLDATTGGIKAVRVLRSGSGYIPNLKIWFDQGGHVSSGGPTGTPADATVTVEDGRIVAVNITAPGSGYNSSLAVRPIAGTYPGREAAGGNPDNTFQDNPKGLPARFTAITVNGSITIFNPVAANPNRGNPQKAVYIPGTEGNATVDSSPAILACMSNVPFPRVVSPASFFRAQVAPPETGVSDVVYNGIIAQYTTVTAKTQAPFNGAFLGGGAPDGYGLGNRFGSSATFVGDIFNLQQSMTSSGKEYPNSPITSYALDSAKTPQGSYEFPIFAQNNPFGGLTDALKSSVQGMQRAVTMLFQNPPSSNNPDPTALGTTWQEFYYAQYDDGVGRVVINPSATQPAWGVVSSVQNPTAIPGTENDSKTGLSKWEKGMLWSGFGMSDQWNDQHYFYGYYIMTAAQAGLFDGSWLTNITAKPTNLWVGPTQMGTAIDQMVMTLAFDPDNTALSSSLYKHAGLTYQKFAFFDQFNGHPWASGASPGSTTAVLDTTNPLGYWGAFGTLSDKYNGENENSVFEGLQAWSATILWGGATDRKAVVDLGIYLLSTNLAAADAYFLDKNYNLPKSPDNTFSWVPVTTIHSNDVINNGGNDGWAPGTSYVDSNPIAFYQAPEFFGGNASAGQSLTKKAENTLNNFFYAYPTGSRFIQAYPPAAWTLGMSRHSDYMKKWAGATLRQEWTNARNSALFQPADWLSMSMTSALAGVPYQPGDQPYPMTGTTPNSPVVRPYIDRVWSSWVTSSAAPGAKAAINPTITPISVLTFLSAFRDHGTPDWTYLARAVDATGADAPDSIVFSAAFTKEISTSQYRTTLVAFNPGWEPRHVAFYRLKPDGTWDTSAPVTGSTPLVIPPKKMILHTLNVVPQ